MGNWWSLLIIRDALGGIRRFSEIQHHLDAAKNILVIRLRAFVDEGILKIVSALDGSSYGEYLLTAKGRMLVPILVAPAQ